MVAIVGKENFDDVLTGSTEGTPVVTFEFQGLSGNDTLRSSAGNDTLDGGPGEDVLVANGGNDDLTGGPDSDRDEFAFGPNDGNDIINDFTADDQIVLLGGSADAIAGLLDDIGQSDAGAIVKYGSTNITLVGVDPSEVSADWFTTA